MSDVKIKIELVTDAAIANAAKLKVALAGLEEGAKGAGKAAGGLGSSFSSAGKIAAGVFLGNAISSALFKIRDLVIETTTAFIPFEKQLVAVGKTTNISGQALRDLGEKFQQLSQDIPVASEDLLRIGTIAGQLGINSSKDILKFTETIARLGVSVEGIELNELATQLARIATLTRTPISEIDRLGSALVNLGNNLAANEGQISTTALQVAKVATIYKISATDVLGLSGALAALGNEAEVSGSATQRLLKSLSEAALNGGRKLATFAELSGETSEAFKLIIKNSPIDAIQKFTAGLGQLSETDALKTLNNLGLTELRLSRVTTSLAGGYEQFSKALELARDGSSKNLALYEESNKAFQTTDRQIQGLSNAFTELQQELSEGINPAFRAVLSTLTNITLFAKDAAQAVKEFLTPKQVDLSGVLTENVTKFKEITKELDEQTKRLDIQRNQQEQIIDARDRGLKFTQNGAKTDDETLKILNAQVRATQQRREELQASLSTLKQQKVVEETKVDEKKGGLSANQQADIDATKDFFAIQKQLREQDSQEDAFLDNLKAAETEAQRQQALDSLELYYTELEIKRQEDKAKDIENEQDRLKALEQIQKDRVSIQEKAADKVSKLEKQDTKTKEREQKERESNFSSTLGTISSLQQSSNKELFAIGKAAAITQATIDGYSAVQKALASAPPPYNFVLAALVGAATAANVSKISSQKAPAFENGGIVPGNNFSGDRVNARVNSGEVILNREQQAKTLFAIANGQGQSSGNNGPMTTVVNIDGAEVARAVSRQVSDGFVLGENL